MARINASANVAIRLVLELTAEQIFKELHCGKYKMWFTT